MSEGAENMVMVYPDQQALSLAAAGLFADKARRAVDEHGRFDVLLSGGETPRSSYQLLGEEPLRGSISWEAVHFFWGDERWVPHDHPESNFGMTRRVLLDHLPLNEAQIHPVPYLETPRASALAYEEVLHRHFDGVPPSFDLVFLGLGEDGHTASLFPGTAVLNERDNWTAEVLGAHQLYRVTVTLPLLNQAALVAFLVQGSAKAAILREVLEGERDPQRIPAQLIDPRQGRLIWLADRDAARLLSEKNRRPLDGLE
jgi:6-phosphogluconolactonase